MPLNPEVSNPVPTSIHFRSVLKKFSAVQKPEEKVKPKPVVSTTLLDVLPTDIILMILSYLPPYSIACLAQTCRGIRQLLDGQALAYRRSAVQIGKFLGCFENAARFENMIVCRTCGRCHKLPNGSRRAEDFGAKLRESLPFDCSGKTNRLLVMPETYLEWPLLHMVMRYHRLSHRHGVPETALSRTSKRTVVYRQAYHPNGVWEKGWAGCSAQVHEGRLLLKVKTNAQYPAYHFNAQTLAEPLTNGRHYELSTCPHVAQTEIWAPVLAVLKGHSADPVNAPWTSLYFKCNQCPSEYIFGIKRVNGSRDPYGGYKRHYVLILRWFMDVGECITPDEPEWDSLRSQQFQLPWNDGTHRSTILGRYKEARDGVPDQQVEQPMDFLDFRLSMM